MGNVNIYLESSNCGNNSNNITRTTDSGIEYRNINGPTGNTLLIGYLGTNGVLSDGSHLMSGIFNGSGVNELDPNSWDNLITN